MATKNNKKIISIIGTRPQFIKAGPVHKELTKFFNVITVHTGQHYDDELSEIFFREFKLDKPKYNLNVGSANHGEQSGKMLIEIEKILLKENPDLVLVYGDTNSTLSGILAATKLNIPTAHIEAGMRSFNRQMPEEINRIVADHLSGLHFCVNESAQINLNNEGVKDRVFLVGDTMYDVFLELKKSIDINLLQEYNLKPNKYILATIHRASNTEDKETLTRIISTLCGLNDIFVVPLHPRTKKYIEKYNLLQIIEQAKNVIILPPQGYIENLTLMFYAKKILTDSGGMQKEAYYLKKPCITLRQETEWTETVDSGWNTLVGSEPEKIKIAVENNSVPKRSPKFFGDGNSSQKIAQAIFNYFKE